MTVDFGLGDCLDIYVYPCIFYTKRSYSSRVNIRVLDAVFTSLKINISTYTVDNSMDRIQQF